MAYGEKIKGKTERRRKQVEMWRYFIFSSCSEQMSAVNYKRARVVITHETRIYLWGRVLLFFLWQLPGVDWTAERLGLRMNLCFILVSALLRRRSFYFCFSLFVRGIDESGEEKKLFFPRCSTFTSSPLIVRGYSSFDPLKLHPGGHRHKELWGKVVVVVGC